MKHTPFEKNVSLSQLLLDTRNPRLPDIQSNQQDTIRIMAITQADKIIALADHIVNNGTNPANLPIIMKSDDNEELYDVLDGNRRIIALKLLESPSLAVDIFDNDKVQRLKSLAANFENNPITELRCVVVSSRDEADTWIQLIHRGQQQGAGLVEWDGQVAARYDARRSSKPDIALEILDYVKEYGSISDNTLQRIKSGKFPITNLKRLLNTSYVRKKLGIEYSRKDGRILIKFPEEEVLKGLARVVDDLGSGRVTVSSIKSQEQRIDYVNFLPEEELPKAETELPTARLLGSVPAESEATSAGVRKSGRQIRKRATLIPRNCTLKIEHTRIREMYRELKRLNVDDFPNSCAVLLRVFIELSLDYFLEHQVRWPGQQIENSSLAQKLTSVAAYFENDNIMTKDQLASIRKAASGQTLLVASIRTMHSYVHNRHFSPIPSELKTAWDDLQLFIEKIWPT